MLPLWQGTEQVCGLRTPVAAGYRVPADRNGTESRKMPTLWNGGKLESGLRTPVAA